MPKPLPFILDPISFGDEAAVQRFLLLRYGKTEYTKGESRSSFEFDQSDADRVIKDFGDRGKDLVVDYDHSTMKGGEAPASGWITALEKGEDGLYATVQWTDKAAERLKAREYRYHSPVIFFDGKGHPAKLHSVALTNHPAMHSYPPLAADDSNKQHEEQKMNENIKMLANALGVAVVALADGSEDEKATAEALNKKITELSSFKTAGEEFMKLHGAKTFDDVTGKIAGMVPASEKAELEGKLAKIGAEKAVEQAFSDGKLVEAQRAWAMSYAESNPQGFADFIQNAPKAAPGPASSVPAGKPAQADQPKCFSDNEKKIIANFGLDPDKIKKED